MIDLLHLVRMHPAEAAVGAGPVGDVALEPGGLVGGVQEDVLGAVAVDGEVVVVVHRSPVAAGEGTEHDRGGGDVVAESRQLVAHGHVVEQEGGVGGHEASLR